MNFAVLVATFGTDAWRIRGASAAAHAKHTLSREAYFTVYAYHDPAGSLADARNHAARAVTADWLVFLDADDELAPDYLIRFVDAWIRGAITTDYAPLLVPAVEYVHPSGSVEPAKIPQQGRWPELNECVIGTGIRRDLFLELGGFRDLPSLEDYDLWLRAYDAGTPLLYVPTAVYRASVNPEGRNRNQSPYAAIWADHLDRVGKES